MSRLALVVILLSSLFGVILAQRTVNVKNNPPCASTHNCDGSTAKPFPDIKTALNNLGSAGGLILLSGESYTGHNNTDITISNKNIVIRNSAGMSLIDCQNNTKRAFTITESSFTMQKVFLENCGNPNIDGGAMYIANSNVNLLGVPMGANRGRNGGSMFVFQSSVSAFISISNSHASHQGGGIYMQQSDIEFQSSDLFSNSPNDIFCQFGSASNAASTLGSVKCTNCFVPNSNNHQICTA